MSSKIAWILLGAIVLVIGTTFFVSPFGSLDVQVHDSYLIIAGYQILLFNLLVYSIILAIVLFLSSKIKPIIAVAMAAMLSSAITVLSLFYLIQTILGGNWFTLF